MMDLNKFKTLTVLALARISSAGSHGVPAGHLYAELMPHCELDEFNAVIANLEKSSFIEHRSNHLLTLAPGAANIGKACEAAVKAL